MAHDLGASTAQAFGNIGANNPLIELLDPERRLLFSLLKLHAVMPTLVGKGKAGDDELERIAKVAADAARFAVKLEQEVFQGPYSDAFSQETCGFRDLPVRLAELSERLGRALNLIGKPGHKKKNFRDQFLIRASELVKLKFGQHYDEHLAELFQAVANRPLKEGDRSGDSIRKRREYLAEKYSDLYAIWLEEMEHAYESLHSTNPQ